MRVSGMARLQGKEWKHPSQLIRASPCNASEPPLLLAYTIEGGSSVGLGRLVMSKTMAMAVIFALVSFGASAGTNGTSTGNAPKPSPTASGAAGPKSTPSVGGPSKGMVPKGGNVATQAPAPSVGGPAASMPKAVGGAPSKPAAGAATPATKPGTTAANSAKAHGGKSSSPQKPE